MEVQIGWAPLAIPRKNVCVVSKRKEKKRMNDLIVWLRARRGNPRGELWPVL